MTGTFKDEFNKIIDFIEKRGMAIAFDNTMGLVNLDRMVDLIIPTPELQADLHEHIRGLLKGLMELECAGEPEDFTGYV